MIAVRHFAPGRGQLHRYGSAAVSLPPLLLIIIARPSGRFRGTLYIAKKAGNQGIVTVAAASM
jgi:hypothetical protein